MGLRFPPESTQSNCEEKLPNACCFGSRHLPPAQARRLSCSWMHIPRRNPHLRTRPVHDLNALYIGFSADINNSPVCLAYLLDWRFQDRIVFWINQIPEAAASSLLISDARLSVSQYLHLEISRNSQSTSPNLDKWTWASWHIVWKPTASTVSEEWMNLMLRDTGRMADVNRTSILKLCTSIAAHT